MEASFTSQLAQFVLETEYDDLPDNVTQKAKVLILDTLGSSLGGLSTDIGQIIISIFRELGGSPECTVLGTRFKTSCANAAWINSKLGNALDADDVFFNYSHFAPMALYPALALGEREDRSGKALITSMVLGYDLAARIRLSALGKAKGQTWTVVAGIVSAAKMLQLGYEELLHALGIGCAFAPVPAARKSLGPPVSMVKYNDTGLAAFLGVIACLMAKNGYTGSKDIFDGEEGFWKLIGADSCDYQLMIRDLGRRWYIMDSALKPYPCCRWIHIPLDLFKCFIDRERLHWTEVDSIIVRVHPEAATPLTKNSAPSDGPSAQFSIPYNMALIAFGIPPGPQWQSVQFMNNEEILRFAQKVRVDVEPEAIEVLKAADQPSFGFSRSAASIEIEAKGKKFFERGNWAKGDPWKVEYAVSFRDIKRKFELYASTVAPLSFGWINQINCLSSMIESVENIQNLRNLTRYLAPK